MDAMKSYYLVFCKFYSSCFMYIDVARLNRYHTFMLTEYGIDNHSICLCSAGEKKHVGIRGSACLANEFLGMVAALVGTIGSHWLPAGVDEMLEHKWMCSVSVIVAELKFVHFLCLLLPVENNFSTHSRLHDVESFLEFVDRIVVGDDRCEVKT